MSKEINSKGKYFTTNKLLQKKVFEFILNEPVKILEPAFGQGDLVKYILKKSGEIKFDMYEIDKSIPLWKEVKENKKLGRALWIG